MADKKPTIKEFADKAKRAYAEISVLKDVERVAEKAKNDFKISLEAKPDGKFTQAEMLITTAKIHTHAVTLNDAIKNKKASPEEIAETVRRETQDPAIMEKAKAEFKMYANMNKDKTPNDRSIDLNEAAQLKINALKKEFAAAMKSITPTENGNPLSPIEHLAKIKNEAEKRAKENPRGDRR